MWNVILEDGVSKHQNEIRWGRLFYRIWLETCNVYKIVIIAGNNVLYLTIHTWYKKKHQLFTTFYIWRYRCWRMINDDICLTMNTLSTWLFSFAFQWFFIFICFTFYFIFFNLIFLHIFLFIFIYICLFQFTRASEDFAITLLTGNLSTEVALVTDQAKHSKILRNKYIENWETRILRTRNLVAPRKFGITQAIRPLGL